MVDAEGCSAAAGDASADDVLGDVSLFSGEDGALPEDRSEPSDGGFGAFEDASAFLVLAASSLSG